MDLVDRNVETGRAPGAPARWASLGQRQRELARWAVPRLSVHAHHAFCTAWPDSKAEVGGVSMALNPSPPLPPRKTWARRGGKWRE